MSNWSHMSRLWLVKISILLASHHSMKIPTAVSQRWRQPVHTFQYSSSYIYNYVPSNAGSCFSFLPWHSLVSLVCDPFSTLIAGQSIEILRFRIWSALELGLKIGPNRWIWHPCKLLDILYHCICFAFCFGSLHACPTIDDIITHGSAALKGSGCEWWITILVYFCALVRAGVSLNFAS